MSGSSPCHRKQRSSGCWARFCRPARDIRSNGRSFLRQLWRSVRCLILNQALQNRWGLALLALNALLSKVVMVNEGDCELELETFLANLSVTGARNGESVYVITAVFAIKLDPTTTCNGTSAKIIIVTKNADVGYRKLVMTDRVRLVSGNWEVVISRKPATDGRINVIGGDDIDLQNINEIVWALSTRLRPDKDVIFGENGRI